jgi:hypothetical protein
MKSADQAEAAGYRESDERPRVTPEPRSPLPPRARAKRQESHGDSPFGDPWVSSSVVSLLAAGTIPAATGVSNAAVGTTAEESEGGAKLPQCDAALAG